MTGFEWFWLIIGAALLVTGALGWMADDYRVGPQFGFWSGVLIIATVISMQVPSPAGQECKPQSTGETPHEGQ